MLTDDCITPNAPGVPLPPTHLEGHSVNPEANLPDKHEFRLAFVFLVCYSLECSKEVIIRSTETLFGETGRESSLQIPIL